MFTLGFKRHDPPWVRLPPWQAKVHTQYMPAVHPARTLPRAVGVNTHIIQKDKLATRTRHQLVASIKSSHSLSESLVKWLTTTPNPRQTAPLPFTARKPKNNSDVAFGVWKGPHCDNRMLHMTPQKSETRAGKWLWMATPCVGLQVTSDCEWLPLAWPPTTKCVNTASAENPTCTVRHHLEALSVATSWQMP